MLASRMPQPTHRGPCMTSDQMLDTLNPAQRVAATQIDGPLLILAGPGSGKTRVITHRIAHMILDSGIDSSRIAALTFTNKAATEMRRRVEQLVPDAYVWTGTFHRFCSRLLRTYGSLVGLQPNFSIYDTSDSLQLVREAVELTKTESRYRPETIASEISRAKSSCLDPDSFERMAVKHIETVSVPVYRQYQQLLLDANAADFDDLLLHVVNLLKNSPELRSELDARYQYLLVDEYQDTNLAQYAIARGLSLDYPNLAVTGDPDQSIYSWRGASLRNILDFEKDYPEAKVVRLEQNYRSTKAILRVADQLIVNNVQRKRKFLHTENAEGQPVRLVAYANQQTEANMIADEIRRLLEEGIHRPDEVAVFYRANWLSRSLEMAFRTAGIPYQVVNGYSFFQRREIKEMLAYLHLLNNPDNNVALGRIINVPPRKIGKVTLQRLQAYASQQRIPLLEAARSSGLIPTLAKATANKLSQFVALYDRIAAEQTDSVEQLMQVIIDETGYVDYLLGEGTEEADERAGNVQELLLSAREFDMQHPDDGGLEAYLEQTALVNDTDAWDENGGAVTLMTMHAAKGLEFPVVFIVGLEEGLVPHERSRENPADLEEERRLFFVGITRAEQLLRISRCMTRFRKGRSWPAVPSRFLMELPRSEMEISEPRSFNDSHFREHNFDAGFELDENQWHADLFGESEPSIDIHADLPADKESSTQESAASVPFEFDDLLEPEHLASAPPAASAPAADPATRPNPRQRVSPAKQAGRDVPASHAAGKPAPQPRTQRSEPANPLANSLVTAADLAGALDASDATSAALKTGRWVFHAEYGKGQIMKLEGQAKKQRAEIEFAEVGRKTILTAFCKLVPLDGK